MDRRNLLGAIIAVPTVGVVALKAKTVPHPVAVAKQTGIRISTIKGDPGELAYAKACGDDLWATVYLNGVEVKHCVTADERDGYIVRAVETDGGNIAFNAATGEVYHETVYGDVRIEFVPRAV